MAWKTAWWAKIKGADRVADQMRNYDVNASVQRAYAISRYAPGLAAQPNLASAAVSSGMDPATARAVDTAFTATAAAKQQSLLTEAGYSPNMQDPSITRPAAAAAAAQPSPATAPPPAATDPGTGHGPAHNVFDWLGHGFSDFFINTSLGEGYVTPQKVDTEVRKVPVVGPATANTANAAWDVGKGALKALGTGLNTALSPLYAPHAAGAADESAWQRNVAKVPIGGAVVNAVADWFRGLSKIDGDRDLNDAQKIDMRRAGYDPDNWGDRYGWYADIHSRNGIINNYEVDRLKGEGRNPYKVDLAREIVASGVDDDITKAGALSPDAQRLLGDIQLGNDKEAEGILKDLSTNSTSLGSHLAYSFGLTPESGQGFTAVQAIGDLAAAWYTDPLAIAGKARTSLRYKQFGVDRDNEAVRDWIAGSTMGRQRWDPILDFVDRQHVLMTSARVEDHAQAARELDAFAKTHADVMPYFSTLLQMRQGSVTGTVFRSPRPNATFRDAADFRANTVGIKRVADPSKYRPVFELRKSIGDPVTQADRDAARAEIATRIGDMIFAWHSQRGEPLIRSQMLMPGQLRVTGYVQRALTPFVDAVLGQRGKLLKQLRDAEGRGIIDFHAAASARAATMHVVDSANGGQWIRENYTPGGMRDRAAQLLSRVGIGSRPVNPGGGHIGDRAAMSLSRFGLTKDAPVIRLDDESATKDIQNFVRFFAPREHAAYVAGQWAAADPATRGLMLNSLAEMAGNARGALDGKANVDFYRQMLKGRETPILPGERAKEAYSSRARDLIDTPAGPTAAAMWSTQFADGVRLPSYVEILRHSEKVGLLSWLTGVSHSRFVNAFTRITKIGQVGTVPNLARQATEGRGMQALENPLGAFHAWKARTGLVANTATERAAMNLSFRQARQLRKADGVEALAPLLARKDFESYADEAGRVLTGTGVTISPVLDQLLRQGVNFDEVAKHRSAVRLAANRFAVDPLRRGRARLYSKLTGEYADEFTYDWLKRVQDGLAEKLLDGVHHVTGGARGHYMDGGLADDIDQVTEGVQHGQRLAKIKLANTHDYLGAVGDTGAIRWGNSLGLRLADPVGAKLAPVVANVALGKKVKMPPEDVAADMLVNGPEGERYRLYGRRAQYSGGKYVGGTADQDAALKAWGEQQVDDLADYLGINTPDFAGGVRNPAHTALLKKIAGGKQIDHDDLLAVPDEFRPEQVHAPVVVGKKSLNGPGKLTERLVDGSSKLYQFVVANPLARLVHDPQTIAAHHEMMAAMEPLARKLKAKGLSDGNIYAMLDPVAYGHAINRVMRYSDNPHATSYFAALSNNFLFYERAMEDFARRAITMVKADPAVLARAHLMWEAAVHSGLVTPETAVDDDGQQQTEYMFTWPGSGLMLRSVNEAAQALGLVDSDVIKQPVWQDLTSPVRWLSPSLQNPIGFTATPLIGLPLRTIKSLFPETTPTIESALATVEGGERYFGDQNFWESMMPVYVKKAYDLLDQSDRDSRVASATRNALIYYSAAGLLPPADAPESTRQRALDQVRQQVQNNLVLQSIAGSFLPATPGGFSSNVNGIGDEGINAFDRARGVDSIRGEWFQLLEDYTKKFPNDSNRAFSEAATEWAKRDLGSVVDPSVFTVGSAGAPGDDTGKSFPSSMELTRWMLNNSDFLKRYGQAAYSMLPAVGGVYYNNIGYQTQLRTGLRQHKDLNEFYDDLIISSTNAAYYQARAVRDDMLRQAGTKAQQQTAYDWMETQTDNLKRANPVWAAQFGASGNETYVAENVAPAVKAMSTGPLPKDLEPHRKELKLMSSLYNEYREAVSTHSGTYYKDVIARNNVRKAYLQKGDELFGDGSQRYPSTPLSGLWKAMSIWSN